jgi:transcriptional regulator with XRE-family HTH domain
MGKLAELSGVSAKTVSQYEQDPPGRPSRKVLDKISAALKVSTDELMACVYPALKGPGAQGATEAQGTIMLEEEHVNRVLRLIDKEIEELRFSLMDGAELAGEYPSLARCMDMISRDIDLLMDIRDRFGE